MAKRLMETVKEYTPKYAPDVARELEKGKEADNVARD